MNTGMNELKKSIFQIFLPENESINKSNFNIFFIKSTEKNDDKKKTGKYLNLRFQKTLQKYSPKHKRFVFMLNLFDLVDDNLLMYSNAKLQQTIRAEINAKFMNK